MSTCPPPPSPYKQTITKRLMEEGGLRKGWIRGLLYVILSLACFLPRPSIAILAGAYFRSNRSIERKTSITFFVL